VTTIGLPLRAELRLRSLLHVVNAKTVDQWSFAEQGGAHVAICDPASALSTLTIKRAQDRVTRFVSLAADESHAAEGTSFIRDPIHPADLIELLNLVSATLSWDARQDALAALGASDDSRDPFPVAVALRGLVKQATDAVFLLEAASLQLHVVPSARTALLVQPLDQTQLVRLAQPEISIAIRQLPASHARRLVDAGAHPNRIDGLLWRLGLHGTKHRLLPELPPDGRFKLRRWPDFGRVEHCADHLRLAARLVRQPASALELAIALGQTPSNVTAFLNACALCDLLEVHAACDAPRPTAPARMSPRYSGLFRTIRSALGLGASS
jgi:hypothetical protein